MKPVLILDGQQFEVFGINYYAGKDEVFCVSYHTPDKDNADNENAIKVVYNHEVDFDKALKWPDNSKYRILRGEDMMADPGYRERLREFSAHINPKPEGVEYSNTLAKGKVE